MHTSSVKYTGDSIFLPDQCCARYRSSFTIHLQITASVNNIIITPTIVNKKNIAYISIISNYRGNVLLIQGPVGVCVCVCVCVEQLA